MEKQYRFSCSFVRPRSSWTIIFFFILAAAAAKDRIAFGFQRLAIHDYFQARENFFQAAPKQPAAAWYENFLSLYPNSLQAPEARRRYEDCLFREQTAAGTVQAFEKFIAAYPESPFRMQAEDSLFSAATHHHTLEEYHAFAHNYPS